MELFSRIPTNNVKQPTASIPLLATLRSRNVCVMFKTKTKTKTITKVRVRTWDNSVMSSNLCQCQFTLFEDRASPRIQAAALPMALYDKSNCIRWWLLRIASHKTSAPSNRIMFQCNWFKAIQHPINQSMNEFLGMKRARERERETQIKQLLTFKTSSGHDPILINSASASPPVVKSGCTAFKFSSLPNKLLDMSSSCHRHRHHHRPSIQTNKF
jgi:hypothetical protein